MKFVRFGGIKAVKQKHFGKEDTFHSPPVNKGFYAMPYNAQEMYIISGISETQPHLFPKEDYMSKVWDKWKDVIDEIPNVYDEGGNNITILPKEYIKDSNIARKKYKQRKRAIRREFTLKYNDIIWHHLEIPNQLIFKRSGSWVSSYVNDYIKALDKEISRLKYNRRITHYGYSKDHFEVFIPFTIK